MTTSGIAAGMVGLGLAARAHAKGYVDLPQVELAAVCDLDRERAERFAEEYGVSTIYTDYEQMLADPDVNLIDIATPTYLHKAMTIQAARAGKHVHCEKPFCRSVSEGMEAVKAVRQEGVKLVVGETYVFLTSHMKARELIEAGEIGRPLQIRERHGAWVERRSGAVYRVPPDRNWRIDRVKSGGGDYTWIFDHVVHFFATAEYLMLDLDIAEVHSVVASNRDQPVRTGASHDPYTTAEVDIPIITWRYADPACQGVWMRAEPLNGKYDYMHGFSTTVVGDKGMIEVLGEGGHNLLWQGQQQHLILHREGKDTVCFRFDEGGDDIWQSDICYYSQGHINQVHHLIECVMTDAEPRYTGEDGVHTVRCTLAAIRSAQLGRPVGIDEVGPDYTAYGEEQP
jgi:predicted dehydrogenase